MQLGAVGKPVLIPLPLIAYRVAGLVSVSVSPSELGKRIRAARIKAGLTQSELAERADVSTNHISAIERGVYDTRVEMLYRIAMVLGVSGDYLLMGAVLQPNTQLARAFRLAERVDDTEKMARYILHGVELIES